MATDAQLAPTTEPVVSNETNSSTDDPFASQREEDKTIESIAGGNDMAMPDSGSPTSDRRMSKEWDAAKVPPSQFQKRKGSIYSTPSSRDSHANAPDRDKAYFEKLKEKGWNILKK